MHPKVFIKLRRGFVEGSRRALRYGRGRMPTLPFTDISTQGSAALSIAQYDMPVGSESMASPHSSDASNS